MSASVRAVIVTHEPNPNLIGNVLAATAGQVDGIVLIDNNSRNYSEWQPKASPQVLALRNHANLGLGAALNRGAAQAIELGAAYLLMLDQDSVPAPNMVARLLEYLGRRSNGETRFAAVGPEWSDARRTASRHGALSGDSVETDFLITSGMLIPVDAYRRIGSFDEGLFIDSTDRDWCFRAQSHGYRLARVSAALMSHEIGERVTTIRGIPGVNLVRHRPERLYFMMRNRLLLYRRKYVPLRWKCYDAFRAIGKFIIFSVLIPPRFANARRMLAGFIDGLRGKTGPLSG